MPSTKETKPQELEIFPGYKGKLVHSKNMTLAYWDIKANHPFPEHSHPNEQITLLIEGELKMTINSETKIYRAGEMVVIPSGVKHSGIALTDCKVVDAFCPIRGDYKIK